LLANNTLGGISCIYLPWCWKPD